MFDARSEAREFVGRDRAEAVTKAAGFFGLSQEELAIAEPEIGVVAGLGARVVVVAAAGVRRNRGAVAARSEVAGSRGATRMAVGAADAGPATRGTAEAAAMLGRLAQIESREDPAKRPELRESWRMPVRPLALPAASSASSDPS